MKIAALATGSVAILLLCGAPALAQTPPPVTMQPIPNPPEKEQPKMHAHKAKHHKKADAPATPAATPAK